METQKRFSILNYLMVLFAFGLLFSCEQLAPVEEPVAVLGEFQDLSGLALEPEDDPINGRLIFSSDCESDCIEPGSGNYFAIRDSKSQSSGINTKKVSYKAYNTEDKFVVKVKYEVTSGPSQAKASIAILINGKKKEFKSVPSGYTATFSIPLEKGWEKCDEVTFSIIQKGLGSPISFSEDYNLIPVCETENSFTDSRDGQVYRIVKIGDQTWFAENLNYASEGSLCYDNDPENCEIYGRLYDWSIALTICPDGWHLPSTEEFGELIDFLGGQIEAGGKLKNIDGWDLPNNSASNESGFSGLPGGTSVPDARRFLGKGRFGNWWSTAGENEDWGIALFLFNTDSEAWLEQDGSMSGVGKSCRCIKD